MIFDHDIFRIEERSVRGGLRYLIIPATWRGKGVQDHF